MTADYILDAAKMWLEIARCDSSAKNDWARLLANIAGSVLLDPSECFEEDLDSAREALDRAEYHAQGKGIHAGNPRQLQRATRADLEVVIASCFGIIRAIDAELAEATGEGEEDDLTR